jgi:hypothetical protein
MGMPKRKHFTFSSKGDLDWPAGRALPSECGRTPVDLSILSVFLGLDHAYHDMTQIDTLNGW